MAKKQRKYETEPSKDEHVPSDVAPDKAMPDQDFKSVIRGIKNASADKLVPLRQGLWDVMASLGLKRKLGATVRGVPKGSDHFDVQSVLRWAQRLDPPGKCKDNKKGVDQLVALHATVSFRLDGRT